MPDFINIDGLKRKRPYNRSAFEMWMFIIIQITTRPITALVQMTADLQFGAVVVFQPLDYKCLGGSWHRSRGDRACRGLFTDEHRVLAQPFC